MELRYNEKKQKIFNNNFFLKGTRNVARGL